MAILILSIGGEGKKTTINAQVWKVTDYINEQEKCYMTCCITELKISLCKLNYKYDETCCLSFLLNNRESLFQLFKQKVYFYRCMFVTIIIINFSFLTD